MLVSGLNQLSWDTIGVTNAFTYTHSTQNLICANILFLFYKCTQNNSVIKTNSKTGITVGNSTKYVNGPAPSSERISTPDICITCKVTRTPPTIGQIPHNNFSVGRRIKPLTLWDTMEISFGGPSLLNCICNYIPLGGTAVFIFCSH